jgi:hypothetical protein
MSATQFGLGLLPHRSGRDLLRTRLVAGQDNRTPVGRRAAAQDQLVQRDQQAQEPRRSCVANSSSAVVDSLCLGHPLSEIPQPPQTQPVGQKAQGSPAKVSLLSAMPRRQTAFEGDRAGVLDYDRRPSALSWSHAPIGDR